MGSRLIKKLPESEWTVPQGARIVAVASNKGGSAKTTALSHFAVQLAQRHLKGLLIDLDQQADCSKQFNPTAPGNIAQALYPAEMFKVNVWKPEQFEKSIYKCKIRGIREPIHLVPGSSELERVLFLLSNPQRSESKEEIRSRLRVALDRLRPFYHYILIDTPPGADNLLYELAFEAADTVIVPVDGFNAIGGMISLLDSVEAQNLSRKGKRKLLSAFVFCAHMAQSNPEKCPWYKLLRNELPEHFAKGVVHHSISVHQTAVQGSAWFSLHPKLREEYKNLYSELFENLMKNETLEPLTEWVKKNDSSIEKIKKKVLEEQKKEGRKVTTQPVKFDWT